MYLFSLFLIQTIDLGYSLKPPRGGGSNGYLQSVFSAKLLKISFFSPMKFSIFTAEKESLYIAWASFRNYHIEFLSRSHLKTDRVRTNGNKANEII